MILGMDFLSKRGIVVTLDGQPLNPDTSPRPTPTLCCLTERAHLNEEQNQELTHFLDHNKTLFSKITGPSTAAEHTITLRYNQPLKQRYYPRNPAMQQQNYINPPDTTKTIRSRNTQKKTTEMASRKQGRKNLQPTPPDEPRPISPWQPPFEAVPWPPNKPRILNVKIFHGPPLILPHADQCKPLFAITTRPAEIHDIARDPTNPSTYGNTKEATTRRTKTRDIVTPPTSGKNEGVTTVQPVLDPAADIKGAPPENPFRNLRLQRPHKNLQKRRIRWHKRKINVLRMDANHALVRYHEQSQVIEFTD
ncbi:PREDICTED: uncharacterized protein LOC108359521 [Rhagoletis zephyria]|uniref:uncharacterized protein LOC108359521 n=1 Tax=Rhagoletis zephyria TaxID=28612 RepID=UPI00081182BA|nr:PREDICTED: uncharacterized protein LOC108359521 [Rhagoletis zephyria]